jgi:hypothetical protein
MFFTAALVNAPWVAAYVLHLSDAGTDAQSFLAYDAQPEGHLGRWGAVLTLGGAWNRDVVPGSRQTWLTLVVLVVMAAVMVVGLARLARENRGTLIALAVPGGLALAVIIAGHAIPDELGRLAADVPGFGLLRDGSRFLAMLAPLEAVAFGAGAMEIARHVPTVVSRGVAVLLLALPFLALPDLAWGVGGRLEATSYPATWERARLTIKSSDVKGDVLVLPFVAYREPAWNGGARVLDPAGRYFDRTTVTEDSVVVGVPVGQRTVRGEDQRAARVRRLLGDDAASGLRPKRLAREGIGIVVVDTEAPGAKDALRAVERLDEFGRTAPDRRGAELRLFAVDGARERSIDEGDRGAVVVAWSLAGLALLVGSVSAARGAIRRKRTLP